MLDRDLKTPLIHPSSRLDSVRYPGPLRLKGIEALSERSESEANGAGREVGNAGYHITATGDVGIGNPFLGGGGPRGIQLAVKFTF